MKPAVFLGWAKPALRIALGKRIVSRTPQQYKKDFAYSLRDTIRVPKAAFKKVFFLRVCINKTSDIFKDTLKPAVLLHIIFHFR